MTNAEILRAWRQKMPGVAGLESFVVAAVANSPHQNDIDLRIAGSDIQILKQSADEVAQVLAGIPGVSGVRDNTAYGKEQLIFSLSPRGQGTGLTGDALGSQLRAGFSGELVQIFQDEGDEIEVRVMLSDAERNNLNILDTIPILLPSTETVPLTDVAQLSYQRGFESLRRNEIDLAVTITADVDEAINNNNAVRADLRAGILSELESRPGITYYKFGGDAEDQGQTLGDVSTALPLVLMLIYVILARVFESYVWQ
jgi:multidrug efflux pump subunit AcrB